MTTARTGVTLIELVVTLALLGVIASVTTLAVRRIQKPPVDDPTNTVSESLEVAITQSRSITLTMMIGHAPVFATVYPDGSVVADTAFHFEQLTGRPINAR